MDEEEHEEEDPRERPKVCYLGCLSDTTVTTTEDEESEAGSGANLVTSVQTNKKKYYDTRHHTRIV